MKTRSARNVCALAIALLMTSVAGAATTKIVVIPSQVPDETPPRVNVGDFPVDPADYSMDSWQGPATGKTNWHARYLADGDSLSAMFPADAATMTIGDLAAIRYWTNRPAGTIAGRDWWVQIYTRPQGGGTDDASWYHRKYINNYNDHTALSTWTQYSTDGGAMTFNKQAGSVSGAESGELTLNDLIASNGSDLIEMISIQTDSGWNGFDGYIDGLEIELTNGNIGRANLEATTPVPASSTTNLILLAVFMLATLSLVAVVLRRRTSGLTPAA